MVSRCGDVMGAIEQAIVNLAPDPHNPELNFKAALEYEAIGQTASAVSFFLRAAEYGYKTHDLIVYTSLIKISHCFEKQKGREHTVENSLNQAVSYLPKRPEAYFFIAQRLERKRDYTNAYIWASMGLAHVDEAKTNPLPADVEYPDYGLLFEKYVSAWWVGRKDESEVGFQYLLDNFELTKEYVDACIANLQMLKGENAS